MPALVAVVLDIRRLANSRRRCAIVCPATKDWLQSRRRLLKARHDPRRRHRPRRAYFDSGAFKADLARRVAIPTESQNGARGRSSRYLESEMVPALEKLGFTCRMLTQPHAKGPFLFAERIEDPACRPCSATATAT